MTSAAGVAKPIAAQAQYQLVLCMLQKGDRAAAAHEFDLLTRDFPDQQDFINKARKLVPRASAAPIGGPVDRRRSQPVEHQAEGAVYRGVSLLLGKCAWRDTVDPQTAGYPANRDKLQTIYLWWKLATNTSVRHVQVLVDQESMRHTGQSGISVGRSGGRPIGSAVRRSGGGCQSVDFPDTGLAFGGGLQNHLDHLTVVLGHGTPEAVEWRSRHRNRADSGGQVFAATRSPSRRSARRSGSVWRARPLVKFQSGEVEAELVKVWRPTVFQDSLAFLKKAGWVLDSPELCRVSRWSDRRSASDEPFGRLQVIIRVQRIYTAPEDIDKALDHACAKV